MTGNDAAIHAVVPELRGEYIWGCFEIGDKPEDWVRCSELTKIDWPIGEQGSARRVISP